MKTSSKRGKWLVGMAASVLFVGLASADTASTRRTDSKNIAVPQERLAEKVRHELVMLPFYGVFDNLGYQIQGGDTVVLTGQVTRPTLKTDAGRVASKVEGVSKVVNDIEVLPLSRFDNMIRLATYRAIFSKPGFEKYVIQGLSPIHIIVKNGNITLTGAVGSQMDRIIAEMAARGIPGTFGVTNELVIG